MMVHKTVNLSSFDGCFRGVFHEFCFMASKDHNAVDPSSVSKHGPSEKELVRI